MSIKHDNYFCNQCGTFLFNVKMNEGSTSRFPTSCSACGCPASYDFNSKIQFKTKTFRPVAPPPIVDDSSQVRSKIKHTCDKCGAMEMEYWELQTRSADEGSTIFYKCMTCQHVQVDYN
mmetsp:Transcript_11736/g.17421  ORF Transcript_11736/g.17421 Transcript_11736/m.17421 type:complete len:119 (-) Transcript_11736:391-747(-)